MPQINKSISFLLGAGFSAPIGYPIGSKLNELLLNCNNENFGFSPGGSLVVSSDGSKPDFGYKTIYDIEFEFCYELIQYFKQYRKKFDYEEFYDYIIEGVKDDENINKIAEPFLYDFITKSSLIDGLRDVFTQVVSYFLRDKNGNKYYDNLPYSLGKYYPGYYGIMNYISDLTINNILNIHTLNHDLFFESFNNTDFFNDILCDGFEELGSPYYGKLIVNSRSYKVRLAHYTGKYYGNIRFYKLHGSLNYEKYYRTEGLNLIPESYIKTRYGIGHTEHFKEIVNNDGKLEYENSWINYHSDFLTGTTSKIERYSDPLLFKKLFELFRENLKNSDRLIIIGYGAKDKEINEIIFNNFDYSKKKSFIVDPFAGDAVKEFSEKLNAKIIDKQLENIANTDFE